MTADEFIQRVRTAATNEEAFAVTREAIAETEAGRLTVDEWNAVWIAYDERTRPWRYQPRNWTGD